MQRSNIRTIVRVFATTCLFVIATGSAIFAESPAEIYQRRIVPLLRAETPSSCRECHFQAVDLKEFMSEDAAATFAQLRARGWIDVDKPSDSKLLSFVARSSQSTTELQAKVRESERLALTEWITAASRDRALLAIPVKSHSDLQLDTDLIRHTRRDQLVDRFVTTVWSQLERCANCHSPDRNAKQVAKNGEQMSWIVPQSPEQTLALLRQRKLIDVDDPKQSLIRTKPLALVEHGAGIKFPEGGETDLAWSGFLEDAARTWKATYKSGKDLPPSNSRYAWRTGLHLRISGLPESTVDRLVTIVLLPENRDGKAIQPIAYAESRVQAARSWSNSLSVPLNTAQWQKIDASKPPTVEQLLASGKYQLIVYQTSAIELFQAIQANRVDQLSVVASSKIDAPWTSGHANSAQLSFAEMTQLTTRKSAE